MADEPVLSSEDFTQQHMNVERFSLPALCPIEGTSVEMDEEMDPYYLIIRNFPIHTTVVSITVKCNAMNSRVSVYVFSPLYMQLNAFICTPFFINIT